MRHDSGDFLTTWDVDQLMFADGTTPKTAGGSGDDETDSAGLWIAAGVGTACAMVFAAWVVARIERAEREADQAPHSLLTKPRFERPRVSRTYPPDSYGDEPSSRLYR